MNPLILQPEVQAFLREQAGRAPSELALAKSPFEGIAPAELATQLDSRQRSRYKLPSWYGAEGIYYPKRLSIEQSSSEMTADYKASFLPAALRILDMTGGFGVDSFAFASTAQSVVYCERDMELTKIVEHNASILGVKGLECIAGDGMTYLQQCIVDQFDLIYVDPARRKNVRKVFRLEDCEPNILEHLPLYFEKSGALMLKLSPMMDIQEAIRLLPGLYELQVVSVDGECKELLCRMKRGEVSSPLSITAVALHQSSPVESSADGNIDKRSFTFNLSDEQQAEMKLGLAQHYLYEPDAALLKAGAFRLTAARYGLSKLHINTHLYTAEDLKEDFIGKITQIVDVLPFADFKKTKPVSAANVITRNFPIKADEIRKKFRIGESKDHNLYFCTDMDGKLIVIHTVPI